jgi:hypothetical protein
MADPVAFHCIEKEHLVRFSDGLVLSDMSDVDASIRKHKLSGNGALFWALISASSSAVRVPYGNGRRFQERVNVKLRQMFVFVLDAHDWPLDRYQSIASGCFERRWIAASNISSTQAD